MTYTKNSISFVPLPSTFGFVDITNRVFGRWAVFGYAGIRKKHTYWWCECQCSTIKQVEGGQLKSGTSLSCGCFREEIRSSLHFVHGHAGKGQQDKLYGAFNSAKGRCTRPKDRGYKNYGGRGIQFQFQSFQEFKDHIGIPPTSKHTLDRINVNDHYRVGNVRWATPKEQANNKRNNRILDFRGEQRTVSEWCEILHLVHRLVNVRLWRQWCASCALTSPLGGHCPHH